MPSQKAGLTIMKASIIKLGASGDVIHTTEILHLLKNYSDIDWITEEKIK